MDQAGATGSGRVFLLTTERPVASQDEVPMVSCDSDALARPALDL